MEKELSTKHKQATLINYLKSRIGWELWYVRTNADAAVNSLTIIAPTEAVALNAENYYRKLYGCVNKTSLVPSVQFSLTRNFWLKRSFSAIS